nr:MAG TPA: hypothetical protein [Caudoviricetes sp.]
MRPGRRAFADGPSSRGIRQNRRTSPCCWYAM